jgi:hypothetical protein
VWYCSKEHQKNDWKAHKPVCGNNSKKGQNTPQSSTPTSPSIPWQPGYLFVASKDGLCENILLVFHGLGDSEAPFATFASKLELPQTSSISLRAPLSVPLMENSYMWIPSFDEKFNLIQFSPSRVSHLKKLRQVLSTTIPSL